MTAPLTPRTLAAGALLTLALLAALVGRGFWGFSYDDAFITYRYADQWARGNGLTFNTGEQVLGTSAPGYALLLGVLSRGTGFLGIGAPEWGTLLSLAALLLIAWTLAVALSNASAGIRFGAPLLFGAGALLWRWNLEMLGCENLPVAALVAAGAYGTFVREKDFAGGLALAAATFLRLDAGLAAASFGIVLWCSRKRFPWRFALAGSIPVAVWMLGLYSRFGTVIPSTLAGKRSEYSPAMAAYSMQEWSWLRRSLPLAGCLVLVSLALIGVVIAARRGLWKHPGIQALGLWLVVNEVFYRAVRVPFAPWYHEGMVNALLALSVFGALALCGAAPGVAGHRNRELAATLASGLLLLPILVPSVSYVRRQWRRPPDPRFEVYQPIGLYLVEHARPSSSVAALEVGIVGYFSRCRIVDLSGLVTPELIVTRSEGNLERFLEVSRPAYIVDLPASRADALAFLSKPGQRERYRLVREFPPPWGGAPYRLLERRP